MTIRPEDIRRDTLLQKLIRDCQALTGVIGLIFGWMVLLGPVLMIGWQCLTWLQNGYWDAWPLSRSLASVGIYEPLTTWGGVQKIVHFLFELPTAFGLSVLGLAGIMAFGGIAAVIETHLSSDVRVTIEREGHTQFRVLRSIIRKSEEQVVERLYREMPDGLWRIEKIEWMPRT